VPCGGGQSDTLAHPRPCSPAEQKTRRVFPKPAARAACQTPSQTAARPPCPIQPARQSADLALTPARMHPTLARGASVHSMGAVRLITRRCALCWRRGAVLWAGVRTCRTRALAARRARHACREAPRTGTASPPACAPHPPAPPHHSCAPPQRTTGPSPCRPCAAPRAPAQRICPSAATAAGARL
jgi:hypothetical protein